MRVQINETWRDDLPGRVDDSFSDAVYPAAHFRDPTIFYP
jgi:hypothetical protein